MMHRPFLLPVALLSLSLLAGCPKDEPSFGVEDCRNGTDDDGDGDIDCDDSDCDSSCVEICDNGIDDDGNGLTDCAEETCFSRSCGEICDDGLDNDLDGLVDCDDNNCAGQCPERCDDHIDNDGDGVADCADSDCTSVCDADGDGYFSVEVGYDDCDDDDPNVNPAANEICNEIDDDCDDLIDDDDEDLRGNATWYPDNDGDGWGRGNVGVVTCTPPPNAALQTGDCRDDDPDVNPGMPEICNEVDDNCDFLIDEDDPALDPASLRSFHPDNDGDGYGAPDTKPIVACFPPYPGLAASDDDCDDTLPSVNPGQVERLCDGLDNDCDPATIDDDGLDDDGDGYTFCQGDCDDSEPTANPDGVEVTCNGIDEDCRPGTPDEPDADNDGFSTCDGDCDDTRAGVNPGAAERSCNGIDDDCDPVGTPDDDGIDADGDTYTVCLGDCDDTDPAAHPGLTEIICTDVDEDCDPSTPDQVDLDGDGSSGCDDDCDDNDPTVRPGRREAICDGVDNDCDPATPDDPDADGDGFTACVDDCNDASASINPGAVEIPCNFIDDDCDPSTPDEIDNDADGLSCYTDCDDADPAVQIPSWGRDADGDGSARPPLVEQCDQPTQQHIQADVADDCADNDANRFPGNQEVCGDAIDQDCDGVDYAPCDTGAAVYLSGEAEVVFNGSSWVGSETVTVTGNLSGHLFCSWAYTALDWDSDPTTSGPAPYDTGACSDADGNPCQFAFNVHRTEGSLVEGDCTPFGFDAQPDPATAGWGYTSSYRNGGVNYGPMWMYYNDAQGAWFGTYQPATVDVPTGSVTYEFSLGSTPAPY
jgi:hypothetical protein